VPKPSGKNGNARRGRLVSCKNEKKVRPEGKRNPLNGAAKESSNILQQDNSFLIVVAEKGENVNWAKLFFQGLKPNMEKWLLKGTKPPIMYVVHVMDMLLWK
jgi:hypothetical protein